MAVKYGSYLGGLTSDSPLLDSATTINSPAFANLPTVASPDQMWIELDPAGAGTGPETVLVTAHTASATSVTVTRGQQGTSAVEHASGTTWVHAATAEDFRALPTTVLTTKGDLVVATGANAVARQAVGSNNELLVADSAQANGIKWSQAQTANIADDAVTTAKIADKAVTAAKMEQHHRHRRTRGATNYGTGDVDLNPISLDEDLGDISFDGTNTFTVPSEGSYAISAFISVPASLASGNNSITIATGGRAYRLPLVNGSSNFVGGTVTVRLAASATVACSIRNGTGGTLVNAVPLVEVTKVTFA